jgi:hypothetical protein
MAPSGGRRPHLNVIIGLDDLEGRARAAMLDFGGRLSPEALRLLACDAAVVPIVMNGAGQPLDVGRARRTIPDGLRRAVAARDRGCARHCGSTRTDIPAEDPSHTSYQPDPPTRELTVRRRPVRKPLHRIRLPT